MSADTIPNVAISQFPATILVVDDQPINIQIVFQVLGNEYNILMATSGKQAIKVCHDSRPDLILLDVVMPEQDGLETCRQLKADKQLADIPVIFVTGLQHETDEDACWDAGGVDFIQKPFNTNTLRNRVKAHLALKRQADLLRSLAYLDGLTGIYNRRYFDNVLSIQLAQHRRKLSPLAVLMIDIDYFKKYNDTFGHLAGDDALRKVASALKHNGRQADTVARYGGEEFVVLLADTDINGAVTVAKKMLHHVLELDIAHPQTPATKLSISVGIAVADEAKGYDSNIIELADQQLYLSKQRGRNTYSVVLA
ncbi:MULTISPECIES: diguanylate cyclase [Shewanella]|uniref:Diguanylate cyclase n=1 Tax=bacterium 19MO03SA05 TaxID=2920620 RepID=A0AAU6VJZ2_UNCXX|nr:MULTISPECIES: diguanylate cyclase [Shewanella]EKO3781296.1 diguanylate cyclase [Vibrio metschnikovii]EKO3888277.1 diguanylate cyclase [Vibrio metschnikovii]MBW0296782.1 diguanylate cyclase response regulator [Shewanella xiamenensis]MCS6262056.1 diguanylate cyclase [Shewanella baltica]MCU7986710.1 diguanylate cyclase [Shewanella sp. SW24]